ncbi:MAG TPA: hypothetical protein VMD74_03530 [Candidatus Methylomirabilis sp.]|nr:hypothetical protein [Candidatus Methylomirabilis sp.]
MPGKQNNKNNSADKINLSRYETDVSGVSLRELEAGLWWSKNFSKIKQTIIVLLIIISLTSWGYTIYNMGAYLLFGMNADERMVKNLTSETNITHQLVSERAPKNLIVTDQGNLTSGGKHDYFASVNNPNEFYWATFTYCFGGASGICGDNFILPGDGKYILALAQTQNFTAAISFSNVVWHKINHHVISDFPAYYDQRLDLKYQNVSFTPGDELNLNSLSFTALNDSPFSYWNVPVDIIFISGTQIVAVNRYSIGNFTSNSSRDVKITWPGSIPSYSDILLITDLNIMDPQVYQTPNE